MCVEYNISRAPKIRTNYNYDQYRKAMRSAFNFCSKYRIKNSKTAVFGSGKYRYGFNGMEKDDGVSGNENSYTAEFWQYDSRLGRRWNLDPMAHKMPSISPYATFFNNPIIIKDPKGDFGIVGFLVGFATDVAVQMAVNYATGKPIGDIDYGDALVSGVVGMATGGLGSLSKVGQVGQKLLTAAGIEGKVAATTIKISAVITEEGVKASVDIKASTKEGEFIDFKTVFAEGEYAKDTKEALTDFVVGSTMTVLKDGVTTVAKTMANKTLQEAEKKSIREFKKTALGSANNIKYGAEIEQLGKEIKFREAVIDNSTDVIKDYKSEELKK